MDNMGGIILPIEMMRETANRLDTTGEHLRGEIENHIRIANATAQRLPDMLRDIEGDLETAFQRHLNDMLTARGSIARLIRSAADTTSRLDECAGQAFIPGQ